MKTSSAGRGRKRWLAWYAPVASANRVAGGRAASPGRAVEVRSHATGHWAAAALLAAVLAATGCGSASDRRALEPLDPSRLISQLGEVRDAAGRGDRSAARQALDAFTDEVRRLQGAGALEGPTAGALLLGAQRARSRLEVELAPPAQTQPTQPAPGPQREQAAPEPRKRPEPGGKEQGKKEEKEKNGSGDDEGHKGGKKH
jgi:hypothetical protein